MNDANGGDSQAGLLEEAYLVVFQHRHLDFLAFVLDLLGAEERTS